MNLLPNRTTMMLLTGIAFLFAAGTALAQSNPASCVNDVDCIANPACGGDVCDWGAGMTCKPAGTAAKGMDGWCTTTDDCKCKAMGATCVNAYCTFTRPCDAPGAAACGSTGTGGSGSTGSAGTSGGGDSGGGGCSVGATAPAMGSALLVGLGLLAFSRRRRR